MDEEFSYLKKTPILSFFNALPVKQRGKLAA
jgi:hypothetical protein